MHEIDAKVTARGRQKRVTFPHKLFMDYLAAWYLCTQNIENLKQAFPTWHDVMKHEEIVNASCGLMRGKDEVIMHVINLLKVELMQHIYPSNYYHTMSSIQNECGIQPPFFMVYPSYSQSLSEMLNTAKLVVITDLTGEGDDADLPCNADIVIYADLCNYNGNSGVTTTLHRHRDHIIAIWLHNGSQHGMEQIRSLLPSSSVGHVYMQNCYLPKEFASTLAQISQLKCLTIERSQPGGKSNSLASQGDLLVAAVKSWNGHSKLYLLDLGLNYLPVSVCHPLLVAIAANCPCLVWLDMKMNTLCGCLAGFLQNPPPALGVLHLAETDLHAEDMESLSTAVTARKLQHLEVLDLRGDNNLSEASVTPLLHALLTTLGDRKLKLYVGDDFRHEGIAVAPCEHKSSHHYLQLIKQELNAPSQYEILMKLLNRK